MQHYPATPIIEVASPAWARMRMHVYMKDESARIDDATSEPLNITGTWKDRKSQLVLTTFDDANEQLRRENRREGRTGESNTVMNVGIISSGNAALSVAKHFVPCGYGVFVLLTQNRKDVKTILKESGATVQNLEPYSQWICAEDIAKRFGIHLPQRLFHMTMGCHDAYRSIITELAMQMSSPPTSILFPFGSGEAGLGIMTEVENIGWKTTRVLGIRAPRNPHLGGNGIERSIVRWMETGARKRQFDVQAIDPVLTEEEIAASVPEGIRSEPAAAIPFAWLAHPYCESTSDDCYHRSRFPDCFARLIGNRVVVINSGYGMLQETLDQPISV